MCVCVCVCVREREKETERDGCTACMYQMAWLQSLLVTWSTGAGVAQREPVQSAIGGAAMASNQLGGRVQVLPVNAGEGTEGSDGVCVYVCM